MTNAERLKPTDRIFYGGYEFDYGNRYHSLVELYKNGEFIRTVSIKECKVIHKKSNQKPPSRNSH